MSAIRLEVIASRLEAIAGGLDNVYQSLAADHVPYIAKHTGSPVPGQKSGCPNEQNAAGR